jgi:phosphoribosylglycinamide formyltransferase 1
VSKPLRIGVLISGRGSNLQALIEACVDPGCPAAIELVISDQVGAPGLERAAAAAIPAEVVAGQDRQAFAVAAEALLQRYEIGLVCLAGFMRLLDRAFVESWRDRMVNIHPSLLPAFPGLDPQRRALEAGVRFAGCTVHFVRPETDTGPIVAQAVVPVLPGDDAATLAARILAAEHRIYPLALRLIAQGRVRVEGGRALIDGWQAPAAMLMNPSAVSSATLV